MKLVRRAPSLALCISLAICQRSQADDIFEPIRGFIRDQLIQRQVPSLTVAVSKGDKIIWEQGFGWANRERRIPADENTLYSIASISKPMTATALMTLVAAGKIDLDKPVNDYLGSAKLRARIGNAQDATVRRVANHSAGLPEHYQFFYEDEPWRPPSADETILRFGNLLTPPGETFRYSNLGYGVLSYIISRVSGLTYADYMRREVFLKLGMTRTSVFLNPALKDTEAVRYGDDGQPISPYEFDHAGASAVYSSAHDLVRFGMFHQLARLPDQLPILPIPLIAEMQKPTIRESPSTGYGIGWEVDNTAGTPVISHSGGMPGVNTWLRLIPSEKVTVVVLANADDRLAHTVSDRILTLFLPAWKPGAPASNTKDKELAPLRDLAGLWKGVLSTYREEIPLVLRIQDTGDIHIELGSGLETVLSHARWENGVLTGVFKGSIGIEDANRRPYTLSLNLKLRRGRVLNGGICARADEGGTMPRSAIFPEDLRRIYPRTVQRKAFLLTQWAEVVKQE